MSSMIIIATMITVLLGATAYALLNASAGLTSQIDRATTETRLEQAVRGVLANIVTVPTASSNYYAVPAPDSLTSSNIPSWIMANATNSRGVPFLYCPYTNNNAATSQTITVPSGTYGVTTGALYTGGKTYVTISASRPANASSALAIIVAPGEKASAAGDCTTITATGTVSGNNVRVITEADVMARDTIHASRGEQYYVGTSATGDGSGRNPGNRATLLTAITHANQYRPQYTRLDMNTGAYTATSVFSQTSVATRPLVSTRNSALDIRGAGSGSTTITTASTFNAGFLTHTNFQGISFIPGAANVNIRLQPGRSGTILTNDTGLQYFSSYAGSNMYALGATSLYGVSGESILMYAGSKLYTNAAFNLPTGANYYGGLYRTFGAEVVFGSDSTVNLNTTVSSCAAYIYGSSRIYFMGSFADASSSGSPYFSCGLAANQYYLSGAAVSGLRSVLIYNAGRIVIDRGTTMTSSAAGYFFNVIEGGELYITNSTLGSVGTAALRPNNFAVNLQLSGTTYGSGARIIGGGSNGGWTASNLSVKTSGSNCWEGGSSLFYIAADTAFYNGIYSQSLGAAGFEPWLIANRSSWYCNR